MIGVHTTTKANDLSSDNAKAAKKSKAKNNPTAKDPSTVQGSAVAKKDTDPPSKTGGVRTNKNASSSNTSKVAKKSKANKKPAAKDPSKVQGSAVANKTTAICQQCRASRPPRMIH